MKLYSALFLLLFSCAFASKNQELFLQANEYAILKDYEKALDTYDKIQPKGRAVWYNMAIVAMKEDKLINALVYFNRAQYGASIAQKKQIKKYTDQISRSLHVSRDQSFISKIVAFIALYINAISLLILQLLCITIISLLVILLIQKRRKKRMVVPVFILLLFIIPSLLLKYKSLYGSHGIITKESLVYAGPDNEFHSIAQLAGGSTVCISECMDKWLKIKQNNLVGWIPEDIIEKI